MLLRRPRPRSFRYPAVVFRACEREYLTFFLSETFLSETTNRLQIVNVVF